MNAVGILAAFARPDCIVYHPHMTSYLGAYLRILYNLRYHHWWDITLHAWSIVLLFLVSGLFFFGVLPGGPIAGIIVLAAILILIISQSWARRRMYVAFLQGETTPNPAPTTPLWPEDKLLLRATGLFSVEGREARFTELIAYYRTFETREHAVMARRTASRFLRLGQTNPEDLGMWYIFVTPGALAAVTRGHLYFGSQPQPALKINYTRTNEKGKPVSEDVYLTFANITDREQVCEDLLLDIGGPPRIPWRRPGTTID